jgi:HipA-like protein
VKSVEAEVRLHGRPVGVLRYARGGSEFRYQADLTDPDRYTLGQIFEDDPRTVRRARVGVPAWFANLLPEGALRRQIVRELGGGVVGNTDAHLKNWALRYRDGRTPTLAPVYDVHSLTVYSTYRYAPMALKLNGQQLTTRLENLPICAIG